VQHQTVTDLAI